MNFKGLKNLVLILGVAGAASGQAQGMAEDIGFAIDTNAGLDISAYSHTNVDGGVGFQGALRPTYFFHKHVGAFAGLDYSARTMELVSSAKISWLEFPFGVNFRYSLNSSMINTVGLGLYYAKNLTSSFTGTNLQGGLGFIMTTSTLFPISENFALGLNVDIKFAFFSPFDDATLNSVKTLSIVFGLGSRYQF